MSLSRGLASVFEVLRFFFSVAEYFREMRAIEVC